jgi:uncharacterized glyoxalase superfamily protein PhnB
MMTNRSAPDATITPVLVYADVATAVEWLCRVCGFKERLRFTRDGIVGHAQVSFREGSIMIGRQGGSFQAPPGGQVSQYVLVSVENVDEHFARVKESGGRIIQPPADMPFGERHYTVEDPGGHRWTFSQHIADVAPEEWGATSVVS